MSQMKEEVNTFHMTPNTNIFINKIVDFESQSPYYPNAPRRLCPPAYLLYNAMRFLFKFGSHPKSGTQAEMGCGAPFLI